MGLATIFELFYVKEYDHFALCQLRWTMKIYLGVSGQVKEIEQPYHCNATYRAR